MSSCQESHGQAEKVGHVDPAQVVEAKVEEEVVNQQAANSQEPELRDLETSLLALEKLDRASPELWPDHSE